MRSREREEYERQFQTLRYEEKAGEMPLVPQADCMGDQLPGYMEAQNQNYKDGDG